MFAVWFRTTYLEKTLASLAELSGLDRVTVYVSQDGQDSAVKDTVQKYAQELLAPPNTRGFEHWQRDRVPQLGPDQARATPVTASISCEAGGIWSCVTMLS